MKKKLIVITGQTATGKTSLAAKYAIRNKGELVSCDSRQIYKYLDIVTGKDRKIIRGVPIWLYDLADPKEYFSSYQYGTFALDAVKDIVKRNKTPIIVGGTYFYLKHLLYGIGTHGEPDWKLRKQLDLKTVNEFRKMLHALDPKSLASMNDSDRANPRRLMRRIELAHSKHPPQSSSPNSLFDQFDTKIIGLKFQNVENLKNQVVRRVEERLRLGALQEVETLLKKKYLETDPGLKTIGYKQLIDYLKGRISKDDAIEMWITNEVQYAKRQFVFMKKDKNIKWKTVD